MRYELRWELIRHDRMCAMRWYGNEHSIIEHETGCGIIWILEAPPIHFCRGFLRFNVWQRKTSRRSSWKHRRRSQIGVETVELCWTDLFWLMVVNCGFLCISVIDSGVCLYLATSTSLLRRHNCKHRLPTRISYKTVAWSQLSQVKSSHWTNYRMFFFPFPSHFDARRSLTRSGMLSSEGPACIACRGWEALCRSLGLTGSDPWMLSDQLGISVTWFSVENPRVLNFSVMACGQGICAAICSVAKGWELAFLGSKIWRNTRNNRQTSRVMCFWTVFTITSNQLSWKIIWSER